MVSRVLLAINHRSAGVNPAVADKLNFRALPTTKQKEPSMLTDHSKLRLCLATVFVVAMATTTLAADELKRP